MSEAAPKIAVLDYGIGNLRSAEKALQHVGADASLTSCAQDVERADAVVLPGVGAFGRCMEAIRSSGLEPAALEAVGSGRPFLGICVGMQMLYERSDESPGVDGLGVLPGTVVELAQDVKRPQMQWNTVDVVNETALFDGIADPWFYFVHSYAPEVNDVTSATCDYGGTVTAAARLDNIAATQFHPEKSGRNGLALLKNFVSSIGCCDDL